MTRIARRKLLTSVPAAWPPSWRPARAPALAQGAANVHWLRWTDFVPASDALLKGQIMQECKKATGITLKVETVNANDLQSRITSAIQSGTGADIIMALQQLAAALRRKRGRRRRRGRGDRQGAGRLLRRLQAGRHGRQQVDRRAVDGRRRADRLSQILVRGGRLQHLPRDLGHLPRCRQEAQGQGAADRPDRRPHLRRRAGLVVSLPVVVRRQGGRGRRQDRGAEQQGDRRSRSSSRSRCGRRPWTKAGWPGTTPTTTAPSCPQTISATNNGASIYIEAKKKPDTYQTEKGTPMWQDIRHAGDPQGAGRASSTCPASSPTC